MRCLTVRIDEAGGVSFLADEAAAGLLDLGDVTTRRASWIVPESLPLRWLFRMLRLAGDESRLAAWTRTWRCRWMVDLSPSGWNVWLGPYGRRADALAAEHEWLENKENDNG